MSEFLQNAWYMAAWSHEVGAGPLSRRLVDRRMVLYRAEDGAVVALRDRCPHRFAPLSLGTREGDTLVCAYHGLTFDRTGACAAYANLEGEGFWAQRPVSLGIDQGGARARRMVETLLRRERDGAAA